MLDVFILSNDVGPHGETISALIPCRQTKLVFAFACAHYRKALKDIEADICTVRQAVLSQLLDVSKGDRIK